MIMPMLFFAIPPLSASASNHPNQYPTEVDGVSGRIKIVHYINKLVTHNYGRMQYLHCCHSCPFSATSALQIMFAPFTFIQFLHPNLQLIKITTQFLLKKSIFWAVEDWANRQGRSWGIPSCT